MYEAERQDMEMRAYLRAAEAAQEQLNMKINGGAGDEDPLKIVH
jgi:hypothetical protein